MSDRRKLQTEWTTGMTRAKSDSKHIVGRPRVLEYVYLTPLLTHALPSYFLFEIESQDFELAHRLRTDWELLRMELLLRTRKSMDFPSYIAYYNLPAIQSATTTVATDAVTTSEVDCCPLQDTE
ncbi:hypothetical protein EVAR_14524_1 [Eumeta japonica]|uniref:Uncharacterized protein n=1 Tax=Eumeta variegata TaxID=151549 RepID=A0A4C1U3G2_EUMVA|nr:hypothetical protein EVAR_14524_1 [Eumeta japonica]